MDDLCNSVFYFIGLDLGCFIKIIFKKIKSQTKICGYRTHLLKNSTLAGWTEKQNKILPSPPRPSPHFYWPGYLVSSKTFMMYFNF